MPTPESVSPSTPPEKQEALRLLQTRRDDVQSAQALMTTMELNPLVPTEPDARDMRATRGPCLAYNLKQVIIILRGAGVDGNDGLRA
ncbi:MAG: hypothetical protein ACOY41_05820 [Pseudomonadota bacterium]